MSTIRDYLLWRGDLSLSQDPFNEIDAAILARFCYSPFDGLLSGSITEGRCIRDLCEGLLNKPALENEVIDPKFDIAFIRLMGKSSRFADMKVSGYVNDNDLQRQIQFSACTYNLDGKNRYYVAFRGTDNTIVGWKENLNMGLEFPVPAQQKALEYFERVAGTLKDGSFIIGGHSKGGNLAVYAATYCDDKYNDSISDIYNFDGPGFKENIIDTDDFKKIENRINTFIPEFSVVGLLLEHLEDYYVVSSVQNGIMEHELLTWEVRPTRFYYRERVNRQSRIVDKAITDWLSGLTKEQRELFVEVVFDLAMSSDARTIAEFRVNRKERFNSMVKTYKEMDEDMKAGFKLVTKRLIASAKKAYLNSPDKPWS